MPRPLPLAVRPPFLHAELVAVLCRPVGEVPDGGLFVLEVVAPVIVTAPVGIFIKCPCDEGGRRVGVVAQRVPPVVGEVIILKLGSH